MPRLAAFLQQLRGAFARESLPPTPPEAPPHPRRGFLQLLLAVEPLPAPPEQQPRSRRGLLAAVFGPEELPLETEAAPRRRLPWLTWLFTPEPIDGDSSGPEVH